VHLAVQGLGLFGHRRLQRRGGAAEGGEAEGGGEGDGGGGDGIGGDIDGGGAGDAGAAAPAEQTTKPAAFTEKSLDHVIIEPASIVTPCGPTEPQYLLPPIVSESYSQLEWLSTSNSVAVTVIAASARTTHASLSP